MDRTQKGVLLQYLRKLVSGPNTPRLSDRELLWHFAEHRDELAFTTLVRRHGPMVLRLCQRLPRPLHGLLPFGLFVLPPLLGIDDEHPLLLIPRGHFLHTRPFRTAS
jgi:hypothetical protein